MTNGDHLNYSGTPRKYRAFDKKWTEIEEKLPHEKEYTQFIEFVLDNEDYYISIWDKDKNFSFKL